MSVVPSLEAMGRWVATQGHLHPYGHCYWLLVLALHRPSAGQRFTTETLADWANTSPDAARHTLARMKRAGLIDYESGRKYHPGYEFTRIGPTDLT